ncbi:MAG: cobalt-precorrin 5A hydrolase [Fretibacterium sp.]|nr:cobalt-precorrin 5A hydrolase [Fretibacterium sp.]
MREGPVVLAAFTRAGAELAVKLAGALGGRAFVPERCLVEGAELLEGPVGEWAGRWFPRAGAMVFICACGIAVRAIAPHIRSKTEDPAVIVADERGRFVIPLLSGHIGGANDLARRIADLTGGEAVITTATDVNGLVAVDEWAVKNNCAVENPTSIKEVSSAVLAGAPVGVAVTEQLHPAPWPATLWLRPRVLTLGVGCKRGVPSTEMEAAAAVFLEGAGVSPLSLCAVASIDLKADESALIALAERYGVPFVTFSAEKLQAVPGTFSASERVREVAGVDNVCERAAMLAAGEGAVLLRSKVRYPGMTFALARRRPRTA